jgi:predicted secreted protein
MPKRAKKLLVIHHCLINQNAKAEGTEDFAALEPRLTSFAKSHDLGLLQLPCPELIFAGVDRKPNTKDHYDTQAFRKLCAQIAESYAQIIAIYIKQGYRVYGIVGVDGSPSCGVNTTHVLRNKRSVRIKGKGILVEEFSKRIQQLHFKIPYITTAELKHSLYC